MQRNGLVKAAAFFASTALSLLLGAVVLAVSEVPVLETYGTMFQGSMGTATGLIGSLVYAVPIAFTGLAASIAFRAQVWNIGAEGQLVMGAVGASFAALFLDFLPGPTLLLAVLLCGFAAGALWGLLSALLKNWFNVNEVLSSLMLNYVAILFGDYLVFGPWKDPAMKGWPYSPPFPPNALLPTIGPGGLHFGLVLTLLAALALHVAFRYSRWGFEVAVIGRSHSAARYAGMNIATNTLGVMALSGGVAAIAGVGEVAGSAARLYQLKRGYGYIGILVSWLAGHDPFLILIMSFFYGVLVQGGVVLQMAQVEPALVSILQAAIILFALAGLTLADRFLRTRRANGKGAAA